MNDKKCRICLRTGKFGSIFRNQGHGAVHDKILSVVDIKIRKDDGLPSKICSKCLKNLDIAFDFIKLCKLSDLKLRTKNQIQKIDPTLEVDSKDFNTLNPKNIDDNLKSLIKIQSNQSLEINNDIFKNKVDLIQTKTNQKPQCFMCGRIMSSNFRLKFHLKSHTGEKPFSCGICDKKFVLKQTLQFHMRTHTGEKPYDCKTCGAKFSTPTNLVAHKRSHTGQTPYKCKLCPREFRFNSALIYHIKTHTGEKNFECETCKKSFSCRSDFNKHVKIHNKDRPYKCSKCGAGFKRLGHMKEHMRRLHKINSNIKETRQDNPKIVLDMVTSEASLLCNAKENKDIDIKDFL